MSDQIVHWERHGDILVGIDQNKWKRALLLLEVSVYYGYAPLGNPQVPLREYTDTSKARLRSRLARVVREQGGAG